MKEFFRLTRNALDTDNDETFLHSLIQRNALFGALEQFSSCLSQEFIEKMIFLGACRTGSELFVKSVHG
jgi:hypothetical protein